MWYKRTNTNSYNQIIHVKNDEDQGKTENGKGKKNN